MSKLVKSIDGVDYLSTAGVLLLAAHAPLPKGPVALRALLAAAKRNGWSGSTDAAETVLSQQDSQRAKQLAISIAKFIEVADVLEVMQ